ncbi:MULTISPECIES: hypothetical protein [Rhodopseudomonas]|nr:MULTISPECIES: hypothetical protein [Rhodopseudomonas]NEW86231.1 hypothetical protein [Rhodopseudomonas sp. WA056]
MTDTAFKQKLDETLAPYVERAKANGRTLREEIDALGGEGRPYTPAERVAVSAYFLSQYSEPQPSMTLDEIREGLM